MADPLQNLQGQPAAASPAAPMNASSTGGGTMPPGAAPAAPAPPQQPQSFEQTFDQLSAAGAGGGSPEPGSAAYRPPDPPAQSAQPQQPPVAAPQQQSAQPAQQFPQQLPQQPPSQLPPGATATPPRDIVQSMRQRGYPVPDDWNDDLLLGELGTLVDSLKDAPTPEEVQQFKQLAPQLYEFAQKRPEFEKWLQAQSGLGTGTGVAGNQPAGGAAQPGQQAGQQPAAGQLPALQAPSVDPFADNLVEMGEIARDQKGFYTSQRIELAPYVNQLNARESHRRKFRAEFETDPQGFIQKFVDPFLTEKVKPYEEEIKQLKQHLSQQSQHSATQQIENYFKENYSRFWAVDQAGQQLYGYDGLPMMTAAGTAYANAVRSLEGTVKDPLQRHNAAVQLVDQVLAVSPQAVSPQATSPQSAAGAEAYSQAHAPPAAPPPDAGPYQQYPHQHYQPAQSLQRPPQQQTAAQLQQQRNLNFLQRNRVNQQLNGNGHHAAAGYPNVLPQGNETPPGSNSFEYLFDQVEAARS